MTEPIWIIEYLGLADEFEKMHKKSIETAIRYGGSMVQITVDENGKLQWDCINPQDWPKGWLPSDE